MEFGFKSLEDLTSLLKPAEEWGNSRLEGWLDERFDLENR